MRSADLLALLTDSLVDGWRRPREPLLILTAALEAAAMIAKISLVVAGLAVVSLLGATPSIARDYPFCRKGEAGPGDCKYDTYEQCAAAVSGTAGYCQPNYWLPPAGQGNPEQATRRVRRY